MTATATQGVLGVDKVTPGYWRVTFQNPPINLFDPETFAALRVLLDDLETDPEVRVVVFDSANPDYFISHLDVVRMAEVPDVPGAADLSEDWHHFVNRLAHTGVISIASVRGRARGIGNEFALACDIRFASRERALFGQTEIGTGVVPGGGGLDWLPRLVGRSRSLEIVVGGEDYDADTAELYGWINRSVPDSELDAFVDAFARRVASFEHRALATAKRLVNERTAPPSEGELLQSFRTILELIQTPAAQARIGLMISKGFGQDSETELNLPDVVAQLTDELAAQG
jgi:enoyl-CoA hydratase/carnithine racemase